ncbi:hypothetical protein GCM10007987_02920 [Aliivibrio fischeri]|nr:hypothetical protein GCM10007987_02920 [Aliivibrio fischeri]
MLAIIKNKKFHKVTKITTKVILNSQNRWNKYILKLSKNSSLNVINCLNTTCYTELKTKE